MTAADFAGDIIAASRELVDVGLTVARSGNISIRDGDGMWITPTGIPPHALTEDAIVQVNFAGETLVGEKRPSSEWCMHADLYQARPDFFAIVHTHAPWATSLACLRREVPAFHYMVAVAGGSNIPLADYATFGTGELSAAVCAVMRDRSACLMANHGLLAAGADVASAMELTAVVEELCRQYAQALSIGEPILLDSDEMFRVLEKFQTYGRQDDA